MSRRDAHTRRHDDQARHRSGPTFELANDGESMSTSDRSANPERSLAEPRNQRAKLAQHAFLKFSIPTAHAVTSESLAADGAPSASLTAEFAQVRDALNAAKTAFDEIPGAQFEFLMRQVDLYAGLKRTLRMEYGMQFATNATMKMYELLVQMGLMAGPHGALQRARVFHNAELPGAFIVAVNHYVRTMCPETNYDWLASSYYPGDSSSQLDGEGGILGDQVGFYAGNRGRWLMGPRPNALPVTSDPLNFGVAGPQAESASGARSSKTAE